MAEKITALGTTLTALRGIVMIVAGVFAIAYPGEAIRFVVLVGGGILLLDGVLNLASLDFRGNRDFPFWTGLLRSVSAIAAGLLIVFSPWLIGLMSVEVLRWLIGVQAIVVGLIEMVTPMLARRKPAPAAGTDRTLWGYIASGGAYALFGLAIIVFPPNAAALLARIVAVLMIVYAISLFVRSWRQRSSTGLR